MAPSNRTMQELITTLSPTEVLDRAKAFFSRRTPLYATFLDREGPGFCSFRGQGTEEIAIAATATKDGTLVTASTYLFDMQIARFLSTLPTVDAPAIRATPAVTADVAGT